MRERWCLGTHFNSSVELNESKEKTTTNQSISEWLHAFQLSPKKEKLSREKIVSDKTSLGEEGACKRLA